MIKQNLDVVKANVKTAAERYDRDAGEITLVCVTKNRSLEDIREAIDCGIADVGENKVQETRFKYRALPSVKWHMVGHLQTNKAKEAVEIFDLIHSVDSLRLAQEIDKHAAKLNKAQDILIEVNASGEGAKFGISPEGLYALIKSVKSLNNIKIRGLMTMAPIVENPEQARTCFRKLRGLIDSLNDLSMSILSMGMTQDYEVAIEEGATMVRIGTAIFEGEK